jgi:hypothetical protein
MIVRIFGEGQFDLVGEHLDKLNLLGARLQSALLHSRVAGPAGRRTRP